jgi:hypothetical protein
MANWLETAFGLGDEAEPAPQPAKPRRLAPEVKGFWCVVAQPSGAPGDLGETTPCNYFVEDGHLFLCDERGKAGDGKPYRLALGENERAVAGRLRRAAWHTESGRSDFNSRRLTYGPLGIC